MAVAPDLDAAKILRRISRVKKGPALRNDIMNIIARHLKIGEISQMNKVFTSIDTDHSGNISVNELKIALKKFNLDENIEEIIQRLGFNGEELRYSDFITAAMDRRILLDKEVRWMAFKYFDPEDQGYITLESIRAALEKLGVLVNEGTVKKMIAEVGLKYENWIDFDGFCKLLEPDKDDLSSYSNCSGIPEEN